MAEERRRNALDIPTRKEVGCVCGCWLILSALLTVVLLALAFVAYA